jgi:hypothetical protein
MHWSESTGDVGLGWLTDRDIEVARKELPVAISWAQARLEPGDPEDVLEALEAFAMKRGVKLPSGLALDMDIETMARWPSDLFRQSFSRLWEDFPAHYRRLPEVSEFKGYIVDDLEKRRRDLGLLLELKRRMDHHWAGSEKPTVGRGNPRSGGEPRQIGSVDIARCSRRTTA